MISKEAKQKIIKRIFELQDLGEMYYSCREALINTINAMPEESLYESYLKSLSPDDYKQMTEGRWETDKEIAKRKINEAFDEGVIDRDNWMRVSVWLDQGGER